MTQYEVAMPFLDRVLPRLGRVDRDHLEEILKGLAHERDFLEKVFNLISEGIVVTDRTGKVIFANRAAETMLFSREEDLMGRAFVEVLSDPGLRSVVAEALRSGVGILSREISVQQPSRDHLSVSMVPVEAASGDFGGAIFMLRSITAEMLKQARYAQMRQMQTFGIMAAGIAHEVGNPLSSLDIHLQLIARKIKKTRAKDGRELVDLIGVAQEEIRRLEQIISQFLRATRPGVPELREGEVIPVVEGTLGLLDPEIRRQRVSLEKEYASFVPPVMLHTDHLKQVFINLVRNSLQAMPDGGVLKVAVRHSRGCVAVSITDSGCGISEGHREKIFEPYFTTRDGGAGLGLVIVQRIVSEHGGEVLVASAPGKGTTMTVKLPVPAKYGKLLPPTA
ncbi:MAG: ATP-binding protein [Candidatus Aureabacteria bacterium]|nr:ATP-binding protein [Candidatus Auribacterota bacterium]